MTNIIEIAKFSVFFFIVIRQRMMDDRLLFVVCWPLSASLYGLSFVVFIKSKTTTFQLIVAFPLAIAWHFQWAQMNSNG